MDNDDDDDDGDDHSIMAIVHDPATHNLSLQSLPAPVPLGPDEHLIQVHAVALTNGELGWPLPPVVSSSTASIPGYEMSGTVILAPPTSPFQPNTEVYGCTLFSRQGNARELTVVRTEELGQKPENLSWEEAATVPLSALTAWQALFVHGGLILPQSLPHDLSQWQRQQRQLRQPGSKPSSPLSPTFSSSSTSSSPSSYSSYSSFPSSLSSSATTSSTRQRQARSIAGDDANANKRVLITGAGGGVGQWAVQLARLAGVGHITATCSMANAEFVRGLGAHRVIDGETGMSLSRRWDRAGAAGIATAAVSEATAPQLRSKSSTRSLSSITNPSSTNSAGEKYHVVLDCVGGETLRRAWTSVRHGGTIVSVAMDAETLKPDTGIGMNVHCAARFSTEPNSLQLHAVTRLIEAEMARAAFDSAFPLEQFEAAFEKTYSRRRRGKVVLRLA